MPSPRIDIDLNKIFHNARELVRRCNSREISVTGVTKGVLGSTEIAETMLRAGVLGIGDSHIENIKAMRLSASGYFRRDVSMTLLRSPMLSQVQEVVQYADISLNSEVEVIRALSIVATKLQKVHQVILMVELGDLREGVMPEDVIDTVREIVNLPYISIVGLGTNLACLSGVSPDAANMAQLSALAERIESNFGFRLSMVSGGNSANLSWALGEGEPDIGRINNLRLGESILLGREALHRKAIDGLYTDAISVSAEVIESKLKPSQPKGKIAQSAFGNVAPLRMPGTVRQAILAIGIQDIEVSGLQPPEGLRILGSCSDHLVVESKGFDLFVGQKISFQPNYSSLLRAITSPYVVKCHKNHIHAQVTPVATLIN